MSNDATNINSPDDWTDLADRTGDGLRVALLWSRSTGRVKVTVVHVHSGRAAELDVAPADALIAFHHPFAYRAAAEAGLPALTMAAAA